MNKAVFFDRDGVLNQDSGYVFEPEKLVLVEHAAETAAALKKAGYYLLVITNQAGVARGFYSLADVWCFHRHLQRALLAKGGVAMDAFYVCPHHDKGVVPEFAKKCPCRKPGTEMIADAAKEFSLDLSKCFFIGDRDSDIECALAAGVKSIQYVTPKHEKYAKANHHVTSLRDALPIVLGRK